MIVHIVTRDKFTNGYIRYMQSIFPEYNHFFFTGKGEYELDDGERVVVIDSYKKLFTQYISILIKADKIIISGVWTGYKVLVLFDLFQLIHKTYFHFWGGDFYSFSKENKHLNLKEDVAKRIYFYSFKKAAGLVFLIDGEYEKFQEITHISNRHFVAPMPGDPNKAIDYSKFRNKDWQAMCSEKAQRSIRILVGNSATETNHHLEAFEVISRFPIESFEVFCPLSYGNENYRIRVVESGKKLFGNKFHPILNLMEREEYQRFLSTMDIGIFFNDRQQAMGNISMLLNMGKKVYLREGTSMWDSYVERGYRIMKVSDLLNCSFDSFSYFSVEDWTNNIGIYNRDKTAAQTKAQWEKILNDLRGGGLHKVEYLRSVAGHYIEWGCLVA